MRVGEEVACEGVGSLQRRRGRRMRGVRVDVELYIFQFLRVFQPSTQGGFRVSNLYT